MARAAVNELLFELTQGFTFSLIPSLRACQVNDSDNTIGDIISAENINSDDTGGGNKR
ncbi:hypothetical protein SAMN02745129_1002 [Ferrimonas marina]|uniref:Uncharacterized protein n=2 Tax=Ferrimonas marina TaxID=299255 RepID=A0A1M5ND72_9GAMM|nr:hypothetical protein SAMN02745129_1002 [Ferrimonas marina]